MSTGNQGGGRVAKWVHWIARVFGSLVGALYLFIGVTSAFDERTPWSWESTGLTVLLVFAIGGILLSWRREGIGGAVVTADAIAFGAFAGSTARFNKGFAMLTAGPLLVAGVLFLVSWWMSGRSKAG